MLQHRRCRQTSTHVFLSLVGFIQRWWCDRRCHYPQSIFLMDDDWMRDDGWWIQGWWCEFTRNQSSRCSGDLLEGTWDLCRGSLQRGTSSWSGIDWRKVYQKSEDIICLRIVPGISRTKKLLTKQKLLWSTWITLLHGKYFSPSERWESVICWGSSCLLHSFKTSFLQVFFTVLAWFSGIEDKTNADKFDKHLWLDTTNGQWWRTGYFDFHY